MSSEQIPVLQVAAKAAIMNDKNQVLVARESATDSTNTKIGQFGLIGGRLKPGELFEDGLRRGVFEEVGLEVEVIKPLKIGEWNPNIKGVPHQIIAIFMLCRAKTTDVKLSPEHDEYLWIDANRRTDFDIMEPDCFVIDMLEDKHG